MTTDNVLNRINATLDQILIQQEGISKKIGSLEEKVDELMRLRNLRVIGDLTQVHFEAEVVPPTLFDMKFVDTIYELEIAGKADVVKHIMRTADKSFTAGERGGPSDPGPITSGHFRTMLKRYMFAGKVFSDGKQVFDCCCGRGWGTYILSTYARRVCAVDYDQQLIDECRHFWPAQNITWIHDSVLNTKLFEEREFDVVTGMEIIEHFNKADGSLLFGNLARFLKSGGVFVGTSYFPDTRHQADHHQTLKRRNHLFLWTKQELIDELEKHFSDIKIIDSWMVIAKKT